MTYKLFIDSDVVIDYFSDREPYVESATELFDLSQKGNVVLFISAVSINNIYYIVRRFLGHDKTLKVVEVLLEMTIIIDTTKQDILQALRNPFKDFEDSIQYSSALNVEGLDAIITRNVKDYTYSKLPVMTPLNFLKMKDGM